MVVSFSEEVFDDDLISEMMPLLLEHKEEVCVYSDFVLDPNWDMYKKACEMKMMRTYTARDEGVLIGYVLFIVSFNPHYGAVLQAEQDALYISPDHRGRLLGLQLIKYADNELTEIGVNLVVHHVKVAKDFSPILERLGYSMTKKIYERRLS